MRLYSEYQGVLKDISQNVKLSHFPKKKVRGRLKKFKKDIHGDFKEDKLDKQ